MKKVIGLVGSKEASIMIYEQIVRLGAAQGIGDLYSGSVMDVTPVVKNSVFSESDVRRVANKIGVMIPVNLTAGKPISSQKEAVEYTKGLTDRFGKRGWAADYFITYDFYHRPQGMYLLNIERKEDAQKMKDVLGGSYIEVSVYDTEEEAAENTSGLYVVIGNSKEKGIKDKTVKLLQNIKENYLK